MYSVRIKRAGSNENWLEIHSSYVDGLKIAEATVVKDVNTIDSMAFTIYADNPGYSKITYLTTLIEVWNENLNKRLFRGRVLAPSDRMDSNGAFSMSYECEGGLAYLHDSTQSWDEFRDNTPEEFFNALIQVHNSQVEGYKQFKVGKIELKNPNENVYRSVDDDKDTFDTIKEKLIDVLGGELQLRYETDGTYIDYLTQAGQKGDQCIELSKNLISISRKTDPTAIITVLKPLGASQDRNISQPSEEMNSSSEPRLKIESVNNGHVFLEDEKKIKQFGRIVKTKIWDNVTDAVELKSKALDFLEKQSTASEQYQVDAIDLSSIGLNVDSFENGWTYPVYNPLLGIDNDLRVVGQTIDISNPAASTLSIGDRILSQEEYNQQLLHQSDGTNRIRNAINSQTQQIVSLQSGLSTTQSNISELKNLITDDNTETILSDLQGSLDSLMKAKKEIENRLNELEKVKEGGEVKNDSKL